MSNDTKFQMARNVKWHKTSYDTKCQMKQNEKLDSSKLCEFCTKNCIKFWTMSSLFVTTNDELMGNWWITDEELIKNWWRNEKGVMKKWWRIDEELMKNWWRIDEKVA